MTNIIDNDYDSKQNSCQEHFVLDTTEVLSCYFFLKRYAALITGQHWSLRP